jgi:hypothetical protein
LVEEISVCFIVRDANGQALRYVYCESEPGRRLGSKIAQEMMRGGLRLM